MKIFGSFIFVFCMISNALAQGVVSHLDQDERRLREDDIVLNHASGFLGYRPNAFDSFNNTIIFRKSFARINLNIGSFREIAEEITAFHAGRFPLLDQSIFNSGEGLDQPKDTSGWLHTQGMIRPTNWSYFNLSMYGGHNFNGHSSWYHIAQVFGELRFNKLILSVGRKPLYWGQSNIAPLIFSENATAMNSIQLSTLPVQWPWIFKYLGNIKLEAFISRMNDDRENAHDYFAGYRLGIMPTDWFEMNGAFAYQFGGRNVEGGNFTETLVEILGGRISRGNGIDDSSDITNRAMEMDFRFHARDWSWPTSFYTEQHFEDCCGVSGVFRRSHSYTWGVFSALSQSAKSTKIRLEYTKIANKTYHHFTWLSGWSNDRRFMGHPAGRDSQAVYFTVEQPLNYDSNISLTPFWIQKDRRGRVDRYWIQNIYPAFQESEQRVGAALKTVSKFIQPFRVEANATLLRVFQKYSRADYDTWEWAYLLGFGADF